MDGTALDVSMEWKLVAVARKHAGVTASEDAAGVKPSREIVHRG